MELNEFTEPSVDEENKIDDIVTSLHSRVAEETEKILMSQLEKLGVDISGIELNEESGGYGFGKIVYPDDPKALASYEYKGITILGVRIGDKGMSIEFDIPELKTLETLKGEVQDEDG